MPIKYAIYGSHGNFKSVDELVAAGYVLKPLYGREIFLWSNGTRELLIGSEYSHDGGCKVAGTEYASTEALQSAGLYVLSDSRFGYDCWDGEPSIQRICIADAINTNTGVAEHRFLYHAQVRTLDELHYLGVLLGGKPESVPVWGVPGSSVSGDSGVRYHNPDGYFVKCTSRPDNSEYYATLEECNAHWTTEEPVEILDLYFSGSYKTINFESSTQEFIENRLRIEKFNGTAWTGYSSTKSYKVVTLYSLSSAYPVIALTDAQSQALEIRPNTSYAGNGRLLYTSTTGATGSYVNVKGLRVEIRNA